MKKKRIGIQGELGAFSQQAVTQLLGNSAKTQTQGGKRSSSSGSRLDAGMATFLSNQIEIAPYTRFEDVFQALVRGKIDAAVIPIENTLAGSVHENYDHLLHFDVRIAAETNVRIIHNLIALPGVRFKDIRRVYSHPVALNQCLHFFARNRLMERVPFYDTAGSVKMVMEKKEPDAAAIASALAASIYGAQIVRRSIEDDRRNFTRFFLLYPSKRARLPLSDKIQWKSSVVFTTRNTPGALFRALSAFALRDLNLTKIESRPLRGKPWEYLFYLDFLGREDEPRVQNALRHLAEVADFLRVLGTYPQGH
jgi:prephenate dehydratase